ncbi:MAG: VWA domain-containing protein [bacterium]
MFRFSNYWALILLIFIPYAYYLSKKSLADLSKWRRWSTFFLRSLVFLFLILALSGFKFAWRSNKLCVLFALDVSNSIPESDIENAITIINKTQQEMNHDDLLGLMVFAKDAYVEFPPKSKPQIRTISSEPNKEYTNLNSAIMTSLNLFQQEFHKRLILMSDGNENIGNVFEEGINLVKSNDIKVYTIPLSTKGEGKNEVMIENLIASGRATVGRPFRLSVVISSSVNCTAKLILFRNRNYILEEDISLSAYERKVINFNQAIDAEGTYIYEALIEPSIDTIKENNRSEALVIVEGKPKVLYISKKKNSYIQQILSLEGLQVDVRQDTFMMNLPDLQNYSSIIIDNVPADDLSSSFMNNAERYVHDLGGGFVMIGGENSFGNGGYSDTPIEDLLPVKMMPEQKKYSLAIMLVIDKSGSMSASVGGYTKMDLAKESALSVVELMKEKDQLGIVAFNAEAEEIIRLERISSKTKIESKISAIIARGGTNMYPALNIAFERLNSSDAQLKHVILLSDGMSLKAKESYELVKKMGQSSITVSTIAISEDADKSLLRNMAQAGKGRYYEAIDVSKLPRIFVKETLMASKLIMEGSFNVLVSGYSEILKGIDTGPIPNLRGYVGTSKKENANILMMSDKNDPILVVWQYGLGRTVAFTSDADAKWATEWLNWDNFSKFWSQTIGWTLAIPSGDFDVTSIVKGGKGYITIDAIDPSGNYRNFLDFQANIVKPDLSKERISLKQTGLGRYEGEFNAWHKGAYIINISEAKEGTFRNIGVIASYSPEYRDVQSNIKLLESLSLATGGKFNPSIEDIVAPEISGIWKVQDIWRILLFASIPLFFLDIIFRRLTISLSEIKEKLRLREAERFDLDKFTVLENLKLRKQRLIDVQITEKVSTKITPTNIKERVIPESKEAYTSRLLNVKKRIINN